MQAAPPRPLWSDGENVRLSDLHAITTALLEHTSGNISQNVDIVAKQP